jgi:hypothetical protein
MTCHREKNSVMVICPSGCAKCADVAANAFAEEPLDANTKDGKMTKSYPNTDIQRAIRANGDECRLLWEILGPKDTQIAWLSCYAAAKGTFIVRTYKDGNGYDVLCQDINPPIDDIDFARRITRRLTPETEMAR